MYKYCSSSDDDATPETVPAGTCLLTYDTKQYQYSWQVSRGHCMFGDVGTVSACCFSRG